MGVADLMHRIDGSRALSISTLRRFSRGRDARRKNITSSINYLAYLRRVGAGAAFYKFIRRIGSLGMHMPRDF